MAVLTGICAFGSELLGKELLPASSELITCLGNCHLDQIEPKCFLGPSLELLVLWNQSYCKVGLQNRGRGTHPAGLPVSQRVLKFLINLK